MPSGLVSRKMRRRSRDGGARSARPSTEGRAGEGLSRRATPGGRGPRPRGPPRRERGRAGGRVNGGQRWPSLPPRRTARRTRKSRSASAAAPRWKASTGLSARPPRSGCGRSPRAEARCPAGAGAASAAGTRSSTGPESAMAAAARGRRRRGRTSPRHANQASVRSRSPGGHRLRTSALARKRAAHAARSSWSPR